MSLIVNKVSVVFITQCCILLKYVYTKIFSNLKFTSKYNKQEISFALTVGTT